MSLLKLCLVLGLEGVGKTLLLKSLKDGPPAKKLQQKQAHHHNHQVIPKSAAYQPTVGTNLIDCWLRNGTSITLKECGGLMAPLWQGSMEDADMLIYIVDCSNNTQISAATILLMETLANEDISGKPVLLFFNKTDIADGCPLSLNEFKEITRVGDLVKEYGEEMFSVVSGSCLSGKNLDNIYEWLHQHT